MKLKSEIVQLLEGALPLNEDEAKAVTECIPIKTFEKGHVCCVKNRYPMNPTLT